MIDKTCQTLEVAEQIGADRHIKGHLGARVRQVRPFHWVQARMGSRDGDPERTGFQDGFEKRPRRLGPTRPRRRRASHIWPTSGVHSSSKAPT